MGPTVAILLLWLAFGASHIILSSVKLRPRLVGILGEGGFLGAYSLVALASFVPMVTIYFGNKHSGPLLWSVPVSTPLLWLIYLLMGVSMVLVVAGMMTPSPVAMPAMTGSAGGRSEDGADAPAEPRGVHYITRHAVFMSAALFGVAHLVPNGYASDVAFFAGFPAFVLIGALHQDRRKLITEPGRYRDFHDRTPLIPFTGRHTLRGLKELSPVALVIGIALTVLLRVFHENLFG